MTLLTKSFWYMQFHIYSRQRIKQVLLGSCSIGGYGKVMQIAVLFLVLVVVIILQLFLYWRLVSQLFPVYLQPNCNCFWAKWKQQRLFISAGESYVWYWWAIVFHPHRTDNQNYYESNQRYILFTKYEKILLCWIRTNFPIVDMNRPRRWLCDRACKWGEECTWNCWERNSQG